MILHTEAHGVLAEVENTIIRKKAEIFRIIDNYPEKNELAYVERNVPRTGHTARLQISEVHARRAVRRALGPPPSREALSAGKGCWSEFAQDTRPTNL